MEKTRRTPVQVEGRTPTERSDRSAPTRLPAVICFEREEKPLGSLSRNFPFACLVFFQDQNPL